MIRSYTGLPRRRSSVLPVVFGVGIAVLVVACVAAFYGTIAYVIFHFIAKYW